MPALELTPSAITLRLVLNEPRFVPDGARFPNSLAIEPTSDDKKDAERRGGPVRVSVWDQARTTTGQAVEFRRAQRPLRAYLLPVKGVLAVRVRFNATPLRVVEDPLEELRDQPGGDGHCGLEGLDRGGRPRPEWRDLLDELVRHCTEVDDPALRR
ncbi:MAG: hypothetical protein EXR72_01975 [Myxococcales bacterium]|nr:hypothetical protein [Myxococcales bacterium]